ncbi:hemerythrin domain-containing protein [Pyxidicoccus fallax]|uniref:Hemerythrin domain-containing protein n=1 Tax=Pyxidicoccus fallax TaxID=394095 RepID=A0A848LNY2_9BACT|nr:hemerythrin domain-containing protein [Pyxidicoccus fallax]NMO19585.1 hemerythrin domain-containing protein [Pyxidicoccus fallax]NPC85550.1 hemerythrin domain-containing protein [Pyxidicoccus fallax]
MDAIALLKADHKTVEQLFRKYEKAGPNAHKLKRKLVDQMVHELSVHAVIEEQVFYPAVRARADELGDDVLRALEEHHVVKLVLAELDGMPPEAERFDAKVHVLMENVRSHVLEEESELFPAVKKAFKPQELRTMADVLEMAKKAAPTRPHPLAPDTPPGNLVAGAVSAVMDMGRDALRTARRKATSKARSVVGLRPKTQTPRPAYEAAGDAASP